MRKRRNGYENAPVSQEVVCTEPCGKVVYHFFLDSAEPLAKCSSMNQTGTVLNNSPCLLRFSHCNGGGETKSSDMSFLKCYISYLTCSSLSGSTYVLYLFANFYLEYDHYHQSIIIQYTSSAA